MILYIYIYIYRFGKLERKRN